MNNNVIDSVTVEGTDTVTQEGDITTEKVYTFRKLNSMDTFLMFKIIGKIGINEFTECLGDDMVKQIFKKANGDEKEETTGGLGGIAFILKLANIVIGNIPKCEDEIYQMLSDTSNLTVEQVKDLDFTTFVEMVIDFIKKEEFKDFIKVVSRSFNLAN